MLIHKFISKTGSKDSVYLPQNKIFNYKPPKKIKYGKYYLLNNENYYFCPDIRRKVKFIDNLVVKYTSDCDSICFGVLIDTQNLEGPDYETNIDIEFSINDILSEYELRDMPIIFTDFNQK